MGVGRRLRQAREAKGLSIGEVAARTKIPTRQLAALEGEEYEKLPGGIFVRGHVRAAARAVGLDPAELIEHFEEEHAPPGLLTAAMYDEVDTGPRIRMATEPVPQRRAAPFVALLLLVVSIVLVLVWFGRGRDVPPSSRDERPRPVAFATDSSEPVARPARSSSPRAVGTSGRAATRPVTLQVRAGRTCWLAMTVDGQRAAYRMLQPDETVTARMRERAVLRTGDAGALSLSVDGRTPVPLGTAGAVRTVELTPAMVGERP